MCPQLLQAELPQAVPGPSLPSAPLSQLTSRPLTPSRTHLGGFLQRCSYALSRRDRSPGEKDQETDPPQRQETGGRRPTGTPAPRPGPLWLSRGPQPCGCLSAPAGSGPDDSPPLTARAHLHLQTEGSVFQREEGELRICGKRNGVQWRGNSIINSLRSRAHPSSPSGRP